MKTVELLFDDYKGQVEKLRHACRGIVMKEGKILLSYLSELDIYMIPGGGVEGDESYENCCKRELLEETGMEVKPREYYLEINEYFDVIHHINHYFICDFVKDTGVLHLTEGEKREGYRPVWMPFDEAFELFAKFSEYKGTRDDYYGLYRREYNALLEYKKLLTLETERTVLRHWEESDAEECFKYAKDPEVGPAAGWPVHTDVEDSKRVIRDVLSDIYTFAVVSKETGLPVGSVGLHSHTDTSKGDDEVELGYWIGKPYWGQGLIPEVSREMIRFAFEELGANRVWCGYFDGNDKSKRVQEKLGFKHQYTKEMHSSLLDKDLIEHVSVLTREEWSKQ